MLHVAMLRGRLEGVPVDARGVSTGLLKVDVGLKELASLGGKGLVISRGLVINRTALQAVAGQQMLALVRGVPMRGDPAKKVAQREKAGQVQVVLKAGGLIRGHGRARASLRVAGVSRGGVSLRLAASLRLVAGLVAQVVRVGKKVDHGDPHVRRLLAKLILSYT